MSKIRTIFDRIHYENRVGYTYKEGNIAYLDPLPLTRPFTMPRAQRIIALCIFIVGIVIAVILINTFVVSRWSESMMRENTIQANMTREPAITTIPLMTTLINRSDEEIKDLFKNDGFLILDVSDKNKSSDMALYRLPNDVTLEEAQRFYQQGLNSLNAVDGSRFFVGSWYFATERVNGTSMIVRYADFSTTDPQIAVQNALAKEGIDPASVTKSGIDDSGNTFTSGNVIVEGVNCSWKISALPLKEVYKIPGLTDSGCYVGFRINKS